MGLPARKQSVHVEGPVLRLLRGGGRAANSGSSRTRRSPAAEVARYRRLFQTTTAVLILVMGLGMARVQVTVQATEAAMAANTLKEDIESERIRAETLEADRTALATPSRIESIAGVSMGMGVAEEVDYLELPASDASDPQTDSSTAAEDDSLAVSERVAAVFADVMRMTAGEAQVLLVGDAGLASSR